MNEENIPKPRKLFSILVFGILIALGLAFGGYFISCGLTHIKMADRYVSAKGLSEKQVEADVAIWNISFKASGDDLQQVNAKAANDQKTINNFLLALGFLGTEIEPQQTSVIDQYATDYQPSSKPQQRYIINSVIKIRTTNVKLVQQASKLASDLIAQGIVLNKDYGPNPRYLFTKLDSIRPAMLEEATKSARLVAEQFAKNSHSKLGTIKHASQGVFQILSSDTVLQQGYSADQDQESNVNKTVRVVTSIDYFLEK